MDLLRYHEEVIPMAKALLPADELVETHKPKNFKFKYYFKGDILTELESLGYDILSTDTIKNDQLTNYAYNEVAYDYKERNIIGKAKEH